MDAQETSVQKTRKRLKKSAAFGDDFDLKNYDDLIGLAGDKYAALFR